MAKITKDLGNGDIFREESMTSPRYGLGVRYQKQDDHWRLKTWHLWAAATLVFGLALLAFY